LRRGFDFFFLFFSLKRCAGDGLRGGEKGNGICEAGNGWRGNAVGRSEDKEKVEKF
jgi:hypothetical protein